MKKNAIIKEKNIICKRPGTGISPIYIDKVLGKAIKKKSKRRPYIKME